VAFVGRREYVLERGRRRFSLSILPHRLTLETSSSILASVSLVQRLCAVLLCLASLAGNAVVCAGWLPRAEARMACCVEGGNCPEHERDSRMPGTRRVLTQAQADRCCALSERGGSSPSTPTFAPSISVAVLEPGVMPPTSVPALVLSAAWRTVAPLPAAAVPKHLLLSVFLV